jgi:outer membrane lipoprotein-sorting protein
MLIVLLFAALFLAAEPAAPDAQAIARALEARYHGARTLQAVFLERYRDGRQGIRVESGTVYFSRPGRMRWEYESPEEKLFLVDGKHVWFYVPADRTASRAVVKESEDWRTPFALLTGKARLSRLCRKLEIVSEDGAKSALSREDRSTSPQNVVLRCSPRGEDQYPAFRATWKPNSSSGIGGRMFPCRNPNFTLSPRPASQLWMKPAWRARNPERRSSAGDLPRAPSSIESRSKLPLHDPPAGESKLSGEPASPAGSGS